jgi:hypothetical protein
VTQPIKAPSLETSTKMVSDLMLKDAAFRKKNTNDLGEEISKKELEAVRKDPNGKTARAWYEMTNIKMVYDAEFDPDAAPVQKKVRETLLAKGYNAIRDENDVRSKVSKAPIIILAPEKSLKVVSVTTITDELRKANKQKLKQYKSHGKIWVDQQLYS